MAVATLSPANLKAFFDANPGVYKVHDLQPDGYSPSGQLGNLLVTPRGTQPNPVAATQVPKPVTTASLMSAAPATLTALAAQADVSDPSLSMDGLLEISFDEEATWSGAGGGIGGRDLRNHYTFIRQLFLITDNPNDGQCLYTKSAAGICKRQRKCHIGIPRRCDSRKFAYLPGRRVDVN